MLGRAIFILGWITTAFALIGFGAARSRSSGAAAARRGRRFWTEDGAVVTLMGALAAALIVFSYTVSATKAR